MYSVKPGKLSGEIEAPPSKSAAQREFLLAALSDGRSVISNPLLCEDTLAALDCLKKLGAKIIVEKKSVTIFGGQISAPAETLDCKNSGTLIRFLAGVAARLCGTTKFTGDESLCRRPMKPLLDALSDLGAEVVSNGGCAPFSISGGSLSGKGLNTFVKFGNHCGHCGGLTRTCRSCNKDYTVRVL